MVQKYGKNFSAAEYRDRKISKQEDEQVDWSGDFELFYRKYRREAKVRMNGERYSKKD